MSAVTAVYGPIAGSQQLDITVDGIKTATLVYKVITNGTMSLPAVLSDPLVTAYGVGAGYPLNPDMYISHVGIRDMSDNVIAYDIMLDYTNERELDDNPLLEPARVSFSSEFYQVPVFKDRYGQAVVTKSGEYPEGLFEDAVQTNVTITKNVLTVPSWFISSQGAVNSLPFTVKGLAFPAEKVRLSNVNASDEFTRNGFTFFKLSFTLSYRQKGWKTEFMNRGFYRKLTASGTTLYPCVDAANNPVTTPAPLDINGVQITNPTPANIIILEFDTKPAFDFSILPLT